MSIPRRKVEPRGRLHAGALRWLLGAYPQWIYAKGDCSHGAIVRWRHLIIHKSGRKEWEQFQEDYWNEWRNTMIAWHLQRGWRAPPSHLRGHQAERGWLWNERKRFPRGKYVIKPGERWGLERRLVKG
jgi:hypothetical protein